MDVCGRGSYGKDHMMTGYARHRCLNDFAREVEVRDRMLVSEVAAITQKQGHVSGTATQNKIKWMKRFFFSISICWCVIKAGEIYYNSSFSLTGYKMNFYWEKALSFSK